MSILINKDTKVITQGITGKTGQYHTRTSRAYANGEAAFVAGVHPKKAGENFEGIPIFASVKDASGRPTSTKLGRLLDISASISIGVPARPSKLMP